MGSGLAISVKFPSWSLLENFLFGQQKWQKEQGKCKDNLMQDKQELYPEELMVTWLFKYSRQMGQLACTWRSVKTFENSMEA
jgi:hypothetical protein